MLKTNYPVISILAAHYFRAGKRKAIAGKDDYIGKYLKELGCDKASYLRLILVRVCYSNVI